MKNLPQIDYTLVEEYLDDLLTSEPATYYTGGIRLLQKMTKTHLRSIKKCSRLPFNQHSVNEAVRQHLTDHAAVFGGKLVSLTTRGTRYGAANPMYGKTHSPETRKKLSEHSFAKRKRDAYWEYKSNNGPLKWQDFLKLKL